MSLTSITCFLTLDSFKLSLLFFSDIDVIEAIDATKHR
jgi:hypothetical protein